MAGQLIIRTISSSPNAQYLRIPRHSAVVNIALGEGASRSCPWPALRAGVLKFHQSRDRIPVFLDGKGLIIPAGWVLMDQISYENIIFFRNTDVTARLTIYTERGAPLDRPCEEEPMFLVHASRCHPRENFLPVGTFQKARFIPGPSLPRRYAAWINTQGHDGLENETLFLEESALNRDQQALMGNDIRRERQVNEVLVRLTDGNFVLMRSSALPTGYFYTAPDSLIDLAAEPALNRTGRK